MSENREKLREQIARLSDALARDVDALSDQELLSEAAEDFESPASAVDSVKRTLDSASARGARARLESARRAYDEKMRTLKPKVMNAPTAEKIALLEKFAANDNTLRQKLTLAARNEEQGAADVDGLLGDLIELGVIDEEGNIL